MNNNTTFVVIAIVSALALFGVVMVTVATTIQLQEAEAFHSSGHRFGCVNAISNSGNEEFFNGTETQGACKQK